MIRTAAILLALAAAPALAAPGGEIDTLQQGTYVCELPGDAAGPAGHRQDELGFTVVNASSYVTPRGRGTYLLTGDTVQFTSGPKRGETLHRISSGFLRSVGADGADGRLRCVRQVDNNR